MLNEYPVVCRICILILLHTTGDSIHIQYDDSIHIQYGDSIHIQYDDS